MFERFSDSARKVMKHANGEAQILNHEYVGTEHLLLGLVKAGESRSEEGREIREWGLDLSRLRVEATKIVEARPDLFTIGKLPLTPRLKKVIEYAYDEARSLADTYVRPSHLLLALFRESEGLGAMALANAGLTSEQVREAVGAGPAGSISLTLADDVKSFINAVFAEHVVAPYLDLLQTRGLSASKIHQLVLQSVVGGIEKGRILETDLQEQSD